MIKNFSEYSLNENEKDYFVDSIKNDSIDVVFDRKAFVGVDSIRCDIKWLAEFSYKKSGIEGVELYVDSLIFYVKYESEERDNEEIEISIPKDKVETQLLDKSFPMYVSSIEVDLIKTSAIVKIGRE